MLAKAAVELNVVVAAALATERTKLASAEKAASNLFEAKLVHVRIFPCFKVKELLARHNGIPPR